MTKTDFMRLAADLSNKEIWIRRHCPWCRSFALLIKYQSESYYCDNCEREGKLGEVKQKYYGDFMRQKSSVHI